jgi:hypothetical protein
MRRRTGRNRVRERGRQRRRLGAAGWFDVERGLEQGRKIDAIVNAAPFRS